jgi:hypothetical protein
MHQLDTRPRKKWDSSFATDGFTRDGAEKLAQSIRDYWSKRGYAPDVRVEPAPEGFLYVMRTGKWFVVRSDMVNGRPLRRAKK